MITWVITNHIYIIIISDKYRNNGHRKKRGLLVLGLSILRLRIIYVAFLLHINNHHPIKKHNIYLNFYTYPLKSIKSAVEN